MTNLSAVRFSILVIALGIPSLLKAQFETRESLVANNSPSCVGIGDFNHDGKVDLAVVAGGSNENTIAIMLGNGDGTFQQPVYYTAGVGAEFLTVADFNHDGNLDLAVASESSYIAIMLGNGDGTFQAPLESPTVPVFERYIATGDFNHDGKPDLVMFADQSAVTVLLGNGNGTFQDALTTYAPFDVTALGIGDFNRDGKLDLVTAGTFGTENTVNIWLGNGDGAFTYGASYQGEENPESIAAADFNRDGKTDLAIANAEGGTVSILLGNGDGTFQPAVEYAASLPQWVTAADLNGDGKIDLALASGFEPSGVTVLLGNGDGTFVTGSFYPAGTAAYFVAVADFNGDGKKDMAVPDHHSDDVIVLLNTGTVSFSPTTALNFKKQAVGTKSAAQKVTLTNSGTAELKISSIKAAGQFGMSTTCHPNLAPKTTCTVSVTFTPVSQGAKPVQSLSRTALRQSQW
jgi:FG-GAP-like repeat/Abnormal spindle-like microcephaly-assoc'd, ASPM-SPD-2-Hydin